MPARTSRGAAGNFCAVAEDHAVIDYKSGLPIYEQVYNGILRLADIGALKPGDQLPSVRAVASEAGVNPNTVQKAYTMLSGTASSVPFRGAGPFWPSTRSLRTAGGARRWKISERPWRRPCGPACRRMRSLPLYAKVLKKEVWERSVEHCD